MRLILFSCSLVIIGCVAIPKTTDDFKTGNYNSRFFCSDDSPEETHVFLTNKISECYARENVMLVPFGNWAGAISTGTYIETVVGEEGASQIAMKFKTGHEQGYQQLIEIFPGDSCTTTVKVYELSSGWKKHSERIHNWLDGQEVSGCGLW